MLASGHVSACLVVSTSPSLTLSVRVRGGVRAARPPGRGVPRGVLGPCVLVHLVPLPLLLPRVLVPRVLLASGPGVPLDLYPRKLKTSR